MYTGEPWPGDISVYILHGDQRASRIDLRVRVRRPFAEEMMMRVRDKSIVDSAALSICSLW